MNFVDANLGFMTGGNSVGADSSGNIYKTINGGNNWSMVYYDHKGMINSVKFVSSNIGYAVGNSGYILIFQFTPRIIKTTNTGNGWYIDTLFSKFMD